MATPDIPPCWPSPWGFEADSPPPERSEIFPHVEGDCMRTQGFEDFLQHNDVFVNGITGVSCHSDSYMTLLKYDRADKCVQLLQDTFNPAKEEWQQLVNSWLGSPNTQPPLRLFALGLVHKFDLIRPEIDYRKWH